MKSIEKPDRGSSYIYYSYFASQCLIISCDTQACFEFHIFNFGQSIVLIPSF